MRRTLSARTYAGHLEAVKQPPERILKADARPVASNDDGALGNRRFHGSSPLLKSGGK